jgi:hypothetical protein
MSLMPAQIEGLSPEPRRRERVRAPVGRTCAGMCDESRRPRSTTVSARHGKRRRRGDRTSDAVEREPHTARHAPDPRALSTALRVDVNEKFFALSSRESRDLQGIVEVRTRGQPYPDALRREACTVRLSEVCV